MVGLLASEGVYCLLLTVLYGIYMQFRSLSPLLIDNAQPCFHLKFI